LSFLFFIITIFEKIFKKIFKESHSNSHTLNKYLNFLSSQTGNQSQEAWLPRFLPGRRPLMIPGE